LISLEYDGVQMYGLPAAQFDAETSKKPITAANVSIAIVM
jgi:hypothetical protein